MRYFYTALLLFTIILPSHAGNSERVITLPESVTTGLHNSQELLTIQEQISFAEQRLTESKLLIYPKIDLNMNASKFEHGSPVVLSPSFESIYLPGGVNNHYSTRFTMWQYIYAGGRYSANVRLAEINLSEAKNRAETVRNRVVLDVKRSFYLYRALLSKIKAYEDAIAEFQALREKTGQDKWPELRTRLSFELMAVRHESERLKLTFLDALGLELNTAIELSGDLNVPDKDYDLNKCIAWGFQYRPELRQSHFQETMDSLRIALSLSERYPTLTAGANYEWSGSRFPLEETNWNATINLNVPLFDGLAFWSRIKQRQFQAREKIIHKARIEDQVRLEVRQAFLDYNFWRGQAADLDAKIDSLNEPERKLEYKLLKINAMRDALISQATLDWATGSALNDIADKAN